MRQPLSTRRAVPMLLALCAVLPATARAQGGTAIVRGTVVLIAGADLHIELHAAPRLVPGDTLVVRRDGAVRGALVVAAADSTRAVVAFAGAPFALTRGAALEAELRRAVIAAGPDDRAAAPGGVSPSTAPPPAAAAASARPAGTTALSDSTGRPGAGASTGRDARRDPGPGAHASGYLASDTRWVRERGGGEAQSYGVPSATLSMRVTNLPAHTSVQVFARTEHYPAAFGGAAPGGATRLRLYAARIESRAGPVRIGLGRLMPQHDPFAGPWDGVALEVGDRLSVAAELGWEPEDGNGAPSTRMPRVSLSAQARAGRGATRYRGTLAALSYPSDAPIGRGPLALSTRHSLTSGRFTLSGDVVAERADTGTVAVRRGGVHAALAVGRGGRVHVAYRRYRPLALEPLDTLFELTSQDRVEAGAYLSFGNAALNVNAATAPGATDRSVGASSHLYLRALPGDFEADLSGSLWRRRDTRIVTAGAGLGRITGRVYTHAGYRFERGAEPDPLTAHEIEGEMSVRIARRSSIGAFVVHSTAGGTAGTRLQLRLVWGF